MTRLRLGALFGVLAVFCWAAPARAQQPPNPDGKGTDYFLTVAARVCDRYVDISANKARNNIQESLRDLGPDTLYQPGQLVNPAQEQAMQPKCRPLSGFRLTLGGGISSSKGARQLGLAVGGERPVRDEHRDRGLGARPRWTGLHPPQRQHAAGRDHDRVDGGGEDQGDGQEPRLAGRNAHRPGTRRALSANVRVRRAALLGRQRQRRQRRIRALRRPAPHLLLRLLRRTAADERHDRDHQARREPARRKLDVRLHRQHLLHAPPRLPVEGGQRRGRVADVLPRRQHAERPGDLLDRRGDRPARLAADRSHVHHRARQHGQPRPEPARAGGDRADRRRRGALHLHRRARPAARATGTEQADHRRRRHASP